MANAVVATHVLAGGCLLAMALWSLLAAESQRTASLLPWPVFAARRMLADALTAAALSIRPPHEHVWDLSLRTQHAVVAYLFAEFGVADRFVEAHGGAATFDWTARVAGPALSCADIAPACAPAQQQCPQPPSPASLFCRVLEMGVELGLLARLRGAGGLTWFTLTAAGAMTAADHPTSLRHWLLFLGRGRVHELVGTALERELPSPVPDSPLAGTSFYERLSARPDIGATFARAMGEFTQLQVAAIVEDAHGSWTECRRVCDFAGGDGALLAALLQRAPRAQGVLVERSAVAAAAAKARFERDGVASRASIVQADVLQEPVDVRCDCAVLKGITSDWDDEGVVRWLRVVAAAMQTGGPNARVLVLDHFFADDEEAAPWWQRDGRAELAFKRGMDLLLGGLLGQGARQRTVGEMRALAARAHLRVAAVRPTRSMLVAVELQGAGDKSV